PARNDADLAQLDGVVDFQPGQFFVAKFCCSTGGHHGSSSSARIDCRESGPKLMWPKLSDEERTIFRRITIVMAASYPVLVLVAAVAFLSSERILAAAVHLFRGAVLLAQPPLPRWQCLRGDWPQLSYGPAI